MLDAPNEQPNAAKCVFDVPDVVVGIVRKRVPTHRNEDECRK